MQYNCCNQRPDSVGATDRNTIKGCWVFVRERQPKSSEEAARLADDYRMARKQTPQDKRPQVQIDRRICVRYGKPGPTPTENTSNKEYQQHQNASKPRQNSMAKQDRPKKDLKDIECFNCRQKGHYSSNCPDRSFFLMHGATGRPSWKGNYETPQDSRHFSARSCQTRDC